MENKSKELEVAVEAVLKAGEIVEGYFETEILKEYKEDKSIVTKADKESELAIKDIIFKNFPEHSVMGEESGLEDRSSDSVWYIDPLDGTTNFSNGIPIFAISIALAVKNEVVVGVVYNPVTKSLFYAEKGKGAFFNHAKCRVSIDDTNHSIVTTGSSRKPEDKILAKNLLFDLPKVLRSVRDFGSTASELAYLSRGSIEGDIQIGLNPHDFAAGTLLIQEAGGKITKHDGSNWSFPENYFIASNGVFHDVLVEEVRKEKEKLGIN